jgi:hypothetical protein
VKDRRNPVIHHRAEQRSPQKALETWRLPGGEGDEDHPTNHAPDSTRYQVVRDDPANGNIRTRNKALGGGERSFYLLEPYFRLFYLSVDEEGR